MKLNGMTSIFGAVILSACASVPPAPEPVPVNRPGAESPQPISPPKAPVPAARISHGGPWSFTYAPGTYAFTITTNATVAPLADTTQKRRFPESDQKVTVTLSGTGDLQVVDPAPSTTTLCDSSSALITRAQQLIPKLPAQLAVGDHWRDSTATTGCRGMIPAESSTISNYVVLGDTVLPNMTALKIHRTDSLSATGEGADGQHRIFVTAVGTGAMDFFLDTGAGRFIQSRGSQTSIVNVTTSGKLTQFVQSVTEMVNATRTP